MAANTWMSADAGETWEGPYATGTQRAGRLAAAHRSMIVSARVLIRI
jgi:hypothetical protein